MLLVRTKEQSYTSDFGLFFIFWRFLNTHNFFHSTHNWSKESFN